MESLKDSLIGYGMVSGLLATAVATAPTMPLTYSIAIGNAHNDTHGRSFVSSPELGRMSLVGGLGLMVHAVATRNPKPALATFVASTALGAANIVGGRIRECRLPPA